MPQTPEMLDVPETPNLRCLPVIRVIRVWYSVLTTCEPRDRSSNYPKYLFRSGDAASDVAHRNYQVKEDNAVRISTFFTVLAMLALSVTVTSAQTNDIKFVSMSEFASMQDQIDQLEAKLTSYSNLGGDAMKGGKGGGGKGAGGKGGAGPVWVGGYELTLLRPYISDGTVGNGFGNALGAGHRFSLGRDGGAGMGVRARYWIRAIAR